MKYSWPGNLRELENFVKRYLILGDEALVGKELGVKENGSGLRSEAAARASEAGTSDLKSLVRSLKGEAEMEAIGKALDRTKWNRKEAARLLNISYKALLYKIRQYGLGKVTSVFLAALSLLSVLGLPPL